MLLCVHLVFMKDGVPGALENQGPRSATLTPDVAVLSDVLNSEDRGLVTLKKVQLEHSQWKLVSSDLK